MSIYAMLELEAHGPSVMRTGEIPQNLFVRVSCTDEGIVSQLRDLALRLEDNKQKQLASMEFSEPDAFSIKLNRAYTGWVLWLMLKESCSSGWEPYAATSTDHHLLRKQV